MIEIDKSDYLYKTLHALGVETNIDDEYMSFAQNGIANAKDFNNDLQSKLGLDYIGEIDENNLDEILDYYIDIKKSKVPAKSKVVKMLKEYKQSPNEKLKEDIINSQLKEVLLIACAYNLKCEDINLSDLVQICNLGLITAVDKYDCESKVAFETYLHYWILNSINNELKGSK